jgi:redox-sensing transcriptional repressor
MNQRKISESTVRRLSLYLRLLREARPTGQRVLSSRELAERTGTSSAQVRKDLSLFGSFGKRGRGYDVDQLERTLARILGLQGRWRVGLVGVGKIGSALLGYGELARRGFDLVAAFDVDSHKVGRQVSGVRVWPLDRLEEVIGDEAVTIGIIATPPEAAEETARRLTQAGVTAILNFAPVKLATPDAIAVRTMDVALELEGLSFALTSERENGSSTNPDRAAVADADENGAP